MPSAERLSRLIVCIASEPDADAALDEITRAALELTSSRHVMIAVLNEELGCLEVRYASGEEEIPSDIRKLPVDIGREDGIVAYVAATRSAFISGDVQADPHYRQMFGSTQSEMAVPVRDRHDRLRAVLNMESDRRDAYSDEDLQLVNGMAGLVSLVLDRQEHAKREEALLQIGSSLDTALSEGALVDKVIQVAENVLSFQACSIFLFDPATSSYVLKGTSGRLKEHVGEISYEPGEGFTGWVCDVGQPIVLDHPQQDPRWKGKYTEFASDQIASFLAVPIIGRKRVMGAIRVLRRQTDNPYLDNRFSDDDLRLVQAIAEQVATALENIHNMDKIIRSERMIAWGELSAKSSHMIGNRVFALRGDVNELRHLLSEAKPDLSELRALEQSLATNVTRIEEILQDFRDFVSATQLHKEAADLNKIVRETAEEVFPRRSRVQLELDLEPNLPNLQVDARKLRRALSELIENSLNYVDEGKLQVRTKLATGAEHPRTRVSKFLRLAEIDVEDTGPGVNSESKDVIFQPFFSGRVKGMGLGLSIVKGIVEAHGGHIAEVGEEGKGARFQILLPVTE